MYDNNNTILIYLVQEYSTITLLSTEPLEYWHEPPGQQVENPENLKPKINTNQKVKRTLIKKVIQKDTLWGRG